MEKDSPIKARLRAYSASKKTPNNGSSEKVRQTVKDGSFQEDQSDSVLLKRKDTPLVEVSETTTRGEMAAKITDENGKPLSMEQMLANLTSTVNAIQADIVSLKDSKSKIPTLENSIKVEEKNVKKLSEKQESEVVRLKMLTAVVIRQDKQIEHLKKQVEILQKESKKPNIFVDGLLEEGKSCIQLVKDFFKEQMEIEANVHVSQAFRIGNKTLRTMKITFANPDTKYFVFSPISKES